MNQGFCPLGFTLMRGLNGSLGRTRTYDMFVNSEPLYQLSYQGIKGLLVCGLGGWCGGKAQIKSHKTGGDKKS